jgi:hypothetical protein
LMGNMPICTNGSVWKKNWKQPTKEICYGKIKRRTSF